MARLVRNERAGLLPPRAAAPPVGVRVDYAPAYISPRVPAADALPAGVRLGVAVLGQILGPAAVTGQQQREPDHPGLGRRDKAGELVTLRLPHHRTRLSQSSIARHVPRRSDAASGSAPARNSRSAVAVGGISLGHTVGRGPRRDGPSERFAVDDEVNPLLEERDQVADLRVLRYRVGITPRNVPDDGVP